MCNIFSGHISFGEEDWGKVYFGPTYVHHEIDRESIPHECLLAWETIDIADFGSFIFTHDCGYDVPERTKGTLMGLLKEWGKEQEKHVQEYLEHIATKDRTLQMRYMATERLTNQEVLAKIATEDEDCDVRATATKRITDQETLIKIAMDDRNYSVRRVAEMRITDQETLIKIATEDGRWQMRFKRR